mmetsp:Transcript_1585/g.4623  ORF Transcript_1585/g.4623 Transcript_1585/m.4623 type:complete len:226 (+) Transcript_1585:340-1017(+)
MRPSCRMTRTRRSLLVSCSSPASSATPPALRLRAAASEAFLPPPLALALEMASYGRPQPSGTAPDFSYTSACATATLSVAGALDLARPSRRWPNGCTSAGFIHAYSSVEKKCTSSASGVGRSSAPTSRGSHRTAGHQGYDPNLAQTSSPTAGAGNTGAAFFLGGMTRRRRQHTHARTHARTPSSSTCLLEPPPPAPTSWPSHTRASERAGGRAGGRADGRARLPS